MRQVTLGTSGITASALGFGCASLGSRVDRAAGLTALAAAAEAGVAWFDVAPAYGRGQAEAILGEFLKGRREGLGLCTKVGLRPPASTQGLKGRLFGMAIPLARRAVALVPGLRGAVRRSGAQSNLKQPLTPELITGSLEESLRRMGTDRVEIYGLHNATPGEIAREDNLRALEAVLASGKARAISVAGDAAVALAAAQAGLPFGAVQIALPAPGEGGAGAAALTAAGAAGQGRLVHSILGSGGVFELLSHRISADAAARRMVVEAAGLDDPQAALARLLLQRAQARVPDGVVLMSMFSARSLAANCAAMEAGPAGSDSLALLDQLAGEAAGTG